MKRKITQGLVGLFLLVAASLVSAQTHEKPPVAKPTKNKVVQLRPDLIVRLSFPPADKLLTFTVHNKCKGKAPASDVQIKATKDDGSSFFYMLAAVPPLAAGAKVELTYKLQPQYPVKSFSQKYFTLTADPFNYIKEASETNNVWEKESKPVADKSGYCDPPYDN
jgi:hypothetical protein